jgi:hypothetical protein
VEDLSLPLDNFTEAEKAAKELIEPWKDIL